MARAGFWAIGTSRIRFGRDGRWYADGEPIENRKVADLFSRSLVPRADGGWELQVGHERAPVEVEDTPWVVQDVEGDGESGWTVILNDGSRERLDPATLAVGEDDVLYCRVRGGTVRVRFLRPAYYRLARHFEAMGDGRVGLRCGGRFYAIESAAANANALS